MAAELMAEHTPTDRGRAVTGHAVGVASVRDFGAVGDGKADDSTAFQTAISASQNLFVPPGRYRLGRTVKLAHGQRIFGAGKSAWEPYGEKTFPDVTRSEILVDGILAFDASGSNSTTIEGIAIKAIGGRQSRWGWPSGKQAGAIGLDITGSTQFEARDISFHGLEVAVDSNQQAGSPDTQIPNISDWAATDCGLVFRFGNASSTVYTVRDARIADCATTAHCDGIIDAHRCDGLRLENLRLFHGNGTSVSIRDTPFVTISAVTVFETSHDQVILKNCFYVSATGLLLARAGAYKGARPYPQQVALTLDGCSDVSISGQIQQPTGRAVTIANCTNINLDCAIGTPFWTTGNQHSLDGAVTVTGSTSVNIRSSFGGLGRDYWVSVWADPLSAQTLSGSVSSDRSIGVVRAIGLQQQGGYTFALPTAIMLPARGVKSLRTIRVFIPAGKVFKARSVEITASPAQLCAVSGAGGKPVICDHSEEWLGSGSARANLGSITSQDHVFQDNTTGPAGWYAIDLMLRNPMDRPITVPADTQIRISTVLA
jgi:hypothetical protein